MAHWLSRPARLAEAFCQRFDYDEQTCQVLQKQIEDKLAAAYAKLQAKIKGKK